jgi:hypothetical protein
MPADPGAWRIFSNKHMLKFARLELGERRYKRAQRQKKVRNVVRLPQPLSGEIVVPAK